MNVRNTLAVCVLLLAYTVAGQNAPAPTYLGTQDFPDSSRYTLLYSLEGDSVTFGQLLELHRGQKVFIDFWASWCKDCLASLPDYRQLVKKTKTDNVVYLLLSVDKDEDKWRSAIARFDIHGMHYRLATGWKNPLTNYIGLDWIPRYMVLDEQGQVVIAKSVHADEKRLLDALGK